MKEYFIIFLEFVVNIKGTERFGQTRWSKGKSIKKNFTLVTVVIR